MNTDPNFPARSRKSSKIKNTIHCEVSFTHPRPDCNKYFCMGSRPHKSGLANPGQKGDCCGIMKHTSRFDLNNERK